MSDFIKWYEYMVRKGYMSDTVNKKLLELAFDAGVDLGHYKGMKLAAEWEGLDDVSTGPFWYASED
jgi:hypothetical protein